ncbi:MAG TPA: proteasome activator [Actinomycetota bacterium]|nr:proteasome activator [Actinomycetota bacterium]
MTQDPTSQSVPPEVPEGPAETDDTQIGPDSVHQPAKVMRIATMVKQLLDEVRHAPLDEPSRARMADIYETSVRELGEVLSPELKDELARLSLPFDAESPSEAELRIAHAQLMGWLEGLFHGIQAMLFAQHAESQARLQQVNRPPLPSGEADSPAHGQYL